MMKNRLTEMIGQRMIGQRVIGQRMIGQRVIGQRMIGQRIIVMMIGQRHRMIAIMMGKVYSNDDRTDIDRNE